MRRRLVTLLLGGRHIGAMLLRRVVGTFALIALAHAQEPLDSSEEALAGATSTVVIGTAPTFWSAIPSDPQTYEVPVGVALSFSYNSFHSVFVFRTLRTHPPAPLRTRPLHCVPGRSPCSPPLATCRDRGGVGRVRLFGVL